MDQNTKDVLMIVIPAVTTIATLYVAVLQTRASRNIERIEKNTNNNTQLLAEAAKIAGHGEGVAQERGEQRARDAKK
jgi:hypothetical protein